MEVGIFGILFLLALCVSAVLFAWIFSAYPIFAIVLGISIIVVPFYL